jgi:predicted Fe-S protein YdhL (DUF1289 family)
MWKKLIAAGRWCYDRWTSMTPEQRQRIEDNAKKLSERVLKKDKKK